MSVTFLLIPAPPLNTFAIVISAELPSNTKRQIFLTYRHQCHSHAVYSMTPHALREGPERKRCWYLFIVMVGATLSPITSPCALQYDARNLISSFVLQFEK